MSKKNRGSLVLETEAAIASGQVQEAEIVSIQETVGGEQVEPTEQDSTPEAIAQERAELLAKGDTEVPVPSEIMPEGIAVELTITQADDAHKFCVHTVPLASLDACKLGTYAALVLLFSETETGKRLLKKYGTADVAIYRMVVRGLRGDFKNTARAYMTRSLSVVTAARRAMKDMPKDAAAALASRIQTIIEEETKKAMDALKKLPSDLI